MNNQAKRLPGRYGMIGQSEGIIQIFEIIDQVSTTDISVLIIGESGTGKELVVKAIHNNSTRKAKPLIIVNCGAIPEGIIESELFGHEKGAFTGAVGPRKGYFEMADGGTIFLDEIGEMPLNAQVKILRILEGREFTRVGGGMPHRVDVRVIAATNRELESEVQRGTFRQDLFFRLRAVNIHVPPLRKRKEDIMLLAEYFAYEFCHANQIDFKGFDSSARDVLVNYSWPGNIRELKNLIESIIVLEKGDLIDEATLSKYLKYDTHEQRLLPIALHKSPDEAEREFLYRILIDLKNEIAGLRELIVNRLFPPKRLKPWENDETITYIHEEDEIPYDNQYDVKNPLTSLQDMERELIENTLHRFNGNKRKAAKSLKISERTLYRKIKEYDLPY
ncbi:sigma-54-dependent Fis family transcriptional regulator [candidate division KSB1 bacterium]|nr:sigma-54-dependent Fis family transcriptional regulator [candidate division KSB1 bacterium]